MRLRRAKSNAFQKPVNAPLTPPFLAHMSAPPRPKPSMAKARKASIRIKTAVQKSGPPGSPSQPATNRIKVNGSTSDRRRLSKIFQREI